MIREELEFRIARYADGDMTAAERSAVEAELAGDAEARAVLAEYQTLRTAIEDAAGPSLPTVHWDRLEQLLSAAVARSADEPAAPASNESKPTAGDVPFAAALGTEQEFAIACHADGSLSPQASAEVERLLQSDARARSLLDEYHNLDAATKSLAYSDPMPAVRWDRLTSHICGVVKVGANARLPEEVERQIAEFVDGTLPAEQHEAVEACLAADPAARVMACDYHNLDAALSAAWAEPIPTVHWERFADRISATIDRQAVRAGVRSHKSQPDAYSLLKWLRSPTRMALAASVLIGVALVGRLMYVGGGTKQPNPPSVAINNQPPVEQILVLAPEKPAGASQSDITIGPPAAVADDETGTDDDIISRPPRAFVASGRATPGEAEAQAVPSMPF